VGYSEGVISSTNPLSRVADFLDSQRAEIISDWLQIVRRDAAIPAADNLPRHDLLDHLPNMLAGLAEQFRGADQESEAAESSQKHGEYRWTQNYSLNELLSELSVLREVLGARFQAFFIEAGTSLPENSAHFSQRCLHRFLDKEIAHSVSGYVSRQQEEIRAANDSLRAMNVQVQEFNRHLADMDEKRILMLRTVSHELGNHLQGLTLIASIVRKQSDWESTSRHLEVLSGSVNAMARLTEQLLEYTSLVSGKEYAQIQPCDLVSLHTEVSDHLRAVATEKGLGFRCKIGADLQDIQSDRQKLHRICLNLGTNAVKYTPKGEIHLEFRRLDENSWAIEITDTGFGMNPEEKSLIFNEFYRIPGAGTGERGAGLGLPIAAHLIQLLDGKIEVESEKGRGSTFRVILPAGRKG
jgi:signal transduction histidine kinase